MANHNILKRLSTFTAKGSTTLHGFRNGRKSNTLYCLQTVIVFSRYTQFIENTNKRKKKNENLISFAFVMIDYLKVDILLTY